MGVAWGIGHTATLLLVGLLVLGLKQQIPTPVGLGLECLVGIVLIGLGVASIVEARRKRLHAHRHRHDNAEHIHFHSHAEHASHGHNHHIGFGWKPVLVGMVHGLAGSAALMILILASVPSATLGLVYLVVFGAGSILGMGVVSLCMGLFFSCASNRVPTWDYDLRLAIGTLSTVLGVGIVVEIGFVQGLFLSSLSLLL
jgi:cytochrome c biogenesis protein CcdA